MLESSVEEYLRTEVIALGGRCDKVVNLTRVGWPDREVQWPHIGTDKVELKKPKGETAAGKTSSMQDRCHIFLGSCGVPVYILDTKEKVDLYVQARRYGKHEPDLWATPTIYLLRDPNDPHE